MIEQTLEYKEKSKKPSNLDMILSVMPIPIIAEKKTQKLIDYSLIKENMKKEDAGTTHFMFAVLRYGLVPIAVAYNVLRLYEAFK